MAMTSAVLAYELRNLDPVPTEAQAIVTLTNAYGVFASYATAVGVPITSAGVSLGKAAMASALVGMNAPNAGASKLAAAVQAFWGAVALGLAVSFTGALAITPPPNAGLLSLLTTHFATNTSGSATKEAATTTIAGDFYVQAIIGGTVTFFGPVVSPIF